MSLKRQAVSGVIWTYALQFSSQLINFLVTLVLARLLMPSDFGSIGLLYVFISIGNVIIDGGMGFSIIRTKNCTVEDYNTVFTINIVISLVVFALVWIIAPEVQKFYHVEDLSKVLRLFSFAFIITGFSTVQNAILMKEMRFKRLMYINIPSLVLSGATGATLAYFGFGIYSLVWAALVKSLLLTIQLYFYNSWKPKLFFQKSKFKYHFGFGVKLMGISILDAIFLNIFPVIIGKFFSLKQVGLYTQAESLKQLPVSNVMGALSKVTFPVFVEIQNDVVRLKNVYSKITQTVLSILCPVLLFMAILSKPLVIFLYSEKWQDAAPFLSVLCIAAILPVINSYNVNVLKIKGKSGLLFRIEIVNKLIIVLMIILLFRFGVYGLIWAKVVSSFFNYVVNSYYCGKEMKFSFINQIRSILPILSNSLLATISVYFSLQFISEYTNLNILKIVVPTMVGITIYSIILFLFNKSFIANIRLIINYKK